jgi:hypothetical protein
MIVLFDGENVIWLSGISFALSIFYFLLLTLSLLADKHRKRLVKQLFIP